MGIRDVRAVAQVVGRRTALRYLAIGVGASVLSACSGSPSSPSGQAFAAFVRGTWKIEVTTDRGKKVNGTAEIADGTWKIDWEAGGQHAPQSGSWTLSGANLAITLPSGGASETATASNVPADVQNNLSVSLPWQPPEESAGSGERLAVDYANNNLRIVHINAHGDRTTTSCARA